MFDCPSAAMSIFCEFYTLGTVLVHCIIVYFMYIILTRRNSMGYFDAIDANL